MKFEADLQIMVDLLSGLHEGGPEATQALESLTFLVLAVTACSLRTRLNSGKSAPSAISENVSSKVPTAFTPEITSPESSLMSKPKTFPSLKFIG